GSLIGALGALLAYLAEVQPGALASLRPPRIERAGEAMALDEMTRRNLELVEPLRADAGRGGRPGTLIDVIDETLTAMGARLLRRWLLRPLIVAGPIWERQEAVAELVDDAPRRRALRAELKEMRDLERLAAKVGAGRAQPRDLDALRGALARLPGVADALDGVRAPLLAQVSSLDPLADVCALLERALSDEPAVAIGTGGVIRPGYDPELDELRELHD